MAVTWKGFGPPLFDGVNVMRPQYDLQLIRNDVLQLLYTLPSERRNLPGWGCLLRAVVFEPGDENTAESIRSSIVTAITRFETRVVLRTVDVIWSARDKRFDVIVVMAMKDDQNTSLAFKIAVSESGITNVR